MSAGDLLMGTAVFIASFALFLTLFNWLGKK